jgi:hypothetical protein
LAALKELKKGQAERIEKRFFTIALEQPQDKCEEVLAYAPRAETPHIAIAAAIVA